MSSRRAARLCLCGLSAACALTTTALLRAEPGEPLAPMTPDAPIASRAAPPPEGAARPKRDVGGRRYAFLVSGILTSVFGVAQVPAGIAFFALGSQTQACTLETFGRGSFARTCGAGGGGGLTGVGVAFMVSGGLGVATGTVLIVVGGTTPRSSVVPEAVPTARGGALRWRF